MRCDRILSLCIRYFFGLGFLFFILSQNVCAEEASVSFSTESGQEYFLDIFEDPQLSKGVLSQYFSSAVTGEGTQYIFEDTDKNKDPFFNLYLDSKPIKRFFSEVPSVYHGDKIFYGHKGVIKSEFSTLYTGTGKTILKAPYGILRVGNGVFLIESNGKYQFYNMDKSVDENMRSPKFDNVGEFDHGKAIAQLNGEAVLVDTKGGVLKNYGKKYGYLGNYHNGYLLARDSNILGLSVYGYSAFPLISDSFQHIYFGQAEWFKQKHGEWVSPANRSINGFFLMDEKENIVLDGLCGRYDVNADYFYPGGDKDYTKLSLEVIDQELTSEGYLLTVDDGAYGVDDEGYFTSAHKYGVLNLDGETVVDFLYNGYDRFGKYTVMYLDCGFEVFDENFQKIIVFYSNDYERKGIKLHSELDALQFSLYGKDGIISGEGEILVPAEYQNIDVRDDEFFVAKVDEGSNWQWGVLSQTGVEKIPCVYSSIDKYGERYVVSQDTAQGKVMGILDGDNNLLLPMEYNIQTMYARGAIRPSSHDPRYSLLVVKSLDTGKIRIYNVNECDFITEAFDVIAKNDDLQDKTYYALTNDIRTILCDSDGNIIELPKDYHFEEFWFSKNQEDIFLRAGTSPDSTTYLYRVMDGKIIEFDHAQLQELQTERGLFRIALQQPSPFEKEQNITIYDENFRPVFEKKNVFFKMINAEGTGIVKFSVFDGNRRLYYNDLFEVLFYTEDEKTYDWKGDVLLDFPVNHMFTTECRTFYSAGKYDHRSDGDWSLVLDKAPSFDGNVAAESCASVLLGSPFANVNGKVSYLEEKNFAFRPAIVRDELWLGVEGLEKVFDCTVNVDYATGNIKITRGARKLELYINSNTFRSADGQKKLKQAPMVFDRFVVFPAIEIGEALGAELQINGSTYTFCYDALSVGVE